LNFKGYLFRWFYFLQPNFLHAAMSKRARCSDHPAKPRIPFAYELLAAEKNHHRGIRPSRYSVTATLSIPAENEECPLSLDLISKTHLPFLPENTPFVLDRPLHSKLTLPCGHGFSCMTLLYNFCKNNMTCPCCRAGSAERMDVGCLPRHLRAKFNAQISETVSRETREQEAENLITVAGFVSVMPYHVLAGNGSLSLVIEFFNIASVLPLSTGLLPTFAVTTSLQARDVLVGQHPILEPRTDLRGVSNIAHMGVNAIRLSVMLSMRGFGNVTIDSSPITLLPQSNDESTPRCLTMTGSSSATTTQNNGVDVTVQLNAVNYPLDADRNHSAPSTRFSVHFSQSAAFAHLLIRNILWHPGAETLYVVSNNTGFAAMML
jgi:hypothetical protein